MIASECSKLPDPSAADSAELASFAANAALGYAASAYPGASRPAEAATPMADAARVDFKSVLLCMITSS